MKAWILFLFALLSFPTSANDNNIVVLGDSLSAAFGIQQEQGWVALLQKRLQQQQYDYQVINASISGETTAGGLSRLPALLGRYQPAIVILALGANDGLRGLPLNVMQANLEQIIKQSKAQNAKVLLIGMQLPPNYGPAYTRLFHNSYRKLAEKNQIRLVPFLLEGIGKDRSLFQQDGLHPTAGAQSQILDNVWIELEKLF